MKQPNQPTLPAAPAADTPDFAEQLFQEVIVQTPGRPARADGIAIGQFDDIDDDGTALVSIAAFNLSRVRARTISPLDPSQLGQAVALGFEASDPLQPIILGVMLGTRTPSVPVAAAEVIVDGERVVFHAEREIELRCGEAAIILSADGHIQLRGTYITSQASATQRILGGSVNVN